MKKRVLSLLLVLLMVMSLVPMSALAATTYYINGVSVRYDDFSSSPNECWVYANNIYNKIWGHNFTNSFSDSENSLRDLSDSELTLTAAHLKAYVSNAAIGSCLRICNGEYLHGSDGWGHSQIIVQKDDSGFTVFEGGLSNYPYCREKYYTWNEYVNTGWLGGTYSYIKYVKWPGAPAINVGEPEAVLSNFSFQNLLKRGSTPNSSGTITANRPLNWVWIGVDTKDNQSVISAEANPFTYSFDISSLTTTMQFSKLPIGEYVFKIHAVVDGKYFGLCEQSLCVVESGEVLAKDVSFPSNITVGEKVTLSGQVLSSASMNWVWIGIDTLDNQNVQSFECNPYTTKFDVSDANETINTARLAQGIYAFKIHVVLSGEYYGAYYKEFTVGNPEITVTFDPNGGSVSPTSKTITKGMSYGILPIPTKTNYTFEGWYTEASGGSKVTSSTTVTATANHTLYAHWTSAHTHDYKAAVTAPTCTQAGYTTYTCSCGDSYKSDYKDALGHDYQNGTCTRCGVKDPGVTPPHTHDYKATVTAPTCTQAGYTTYTCSVCGDSYKSDYKDALGHDYKNGTCTRCGVKDPNYKPQANFVDVAAGSYCYDAVQWAVANGITNGTDTTHFSPNAGCTRGQVVTFLWRAAGEPTVSGNVGFVDVAPGSYCYEAVKWAVANGITKGTDATHFSPNATCTRGQVVTFMYRAEGEPAVGGSNGFVDVAAGSYCYNAVQWAVAKGITKGTDATHFSPSATCTRGQVVTFLYRAE